MDLLARLTAAVEFCHDLSQHATTSRQLSPRQRIQVATRRAWRERSRRRLRLHSYQGMTFSRAETPALISGLQPLKTRPVILSERSEFVAAAFAATTDPGREPKDLRFGEAGPAPAGRR
jgi:hypothetical protein